MRGVYLWAWLLVRFFSLFVWRLRWHGTGNVPGTGGVILASNHQSFLDPPLVGVSLTRKVSFMARRSLFDPPVFGPLIAALNAFPVDRDRGDVKAMRAAIDRLKQGHALLVFPEGTRTRDGRIAPMKAGIRLIADRAAVPVIPVLIQGAYNVWPKGRMLPRPWGRVDIYFGKPVRFGDGAADVGALLRDAVAGLAPRGSAR